MCVCVFVESKTEKDTIFHRMNLCFVPVNLKWKMRNYLFHRLIMYFFLEIHIFLQLPENKNKNNQSSSPLLLMFLNVFSRD